MTRCEVRKITPTLLAIAVALLLALLLGGCGVPTPPVVGSVQPPAVSAPENAAAIPNAAPVEDVLLTRAQAEAVALNHAGLSAQQVWGLRSEFDVDDGVTEWDVEFRCDGWEYEYEIHAVSGAIRTFDRERD